MEDPYYTLDTSLFDGQFRYFGGSPVQVRGKVHLSEEQYHLRSAEREIEPITTLRGRRTYVHMKPFVLIPDITLTIGLYQEPGPGGAIGEVLGARERKMREVEIGQAQAWYYQQDQVLIVWECFLHDFVRDAPLLDDANMRTLWEGFTTFLHRQFPALRQIATLAHDPLFSNEEYHAFLTRLGYAPVARAAWGKSIDESEDPQR